MTSDVSLRPATADDAEFLLRVYASSRETEMAMVPWTEAQKSAFLRLQFESQTREYTAQYPGSEHNIVVHSGRDVGRSFLARTPGELHILDVTILTEHRRAGIGSVLIRQWQDEAKASGVPLTIYVETFNPSAAFFTKRGFEAVEQTGMHLLLRWTADSRAGSKRD